MNLFELQQRANILVEKVNQYEASLVGTEIDETDTLNQHKYADLYSLRPVMKLLFGSTLEERLNRTLDNDIPLKVFASSAPANNSTFNLLSFNPGDIRYKLDNSKSGIQPQGSSNYIPALNSSPNYFTFDDNNYGNVSINKKTGEVTTTGFYSHAKIDYYITQDLQADTSKSNLILCSVASQYKDKTSSSFSKNSNITWYFKINQSSNDSNTQLQMTTNISEMYIGIDLGKRLVSGDKLTLDIYFYTKLEPSETTNNFSYKLSINNTFNHANNNYSLDFLTTSQMENFIGFRNNIYTDYLTGYALNSCDIDYDSSYLSYPLVSMDVGYKSDTHEFMNNIDMYNNYNMLQLDVKQNSVTDRDTRIKQGINYSYSSNIADALVTESQIANIFKWNTTNDTVIMNNTMSVNRQVPGIVCYYLGNNYRGVYTATIPYAVLTDNINSVNYSTPAYYGAYYSTDVTTSQVGVFPGADACRIFMPGLNYTRGMLISPQQIWQPEKIVGDDNTNKGFNWQGQAIYHELVFKNRRPGSKDSNVDFIPTIDTVADNDPQGLATRFALAQQKPYYNNRPWFNELDELYGKDATKLVNYINANSISKPPTEYKTVINDTILTKVGEPTLSDSGVASNFSDSNFYTIDKSYITNNCEIVIRLKMIEGSPNTERKLLDGANFLNIYQKNYTLYSFNTKSGGDPVTIDTPGQEKTIYLKLTINNGSANYSTSEDGITYTSKATMAGVDIPTANVYLGRSQNAEQYWTASIDLSKSYIKRSTDTEPINFTKVIQTQGEKFNKDLFTLEDNLSLSNDGILSNLDGTHKVSLSELSYNLTEDIQNVYIYLPEITLTNTGTDGSVKGSPYNFGLNFKSPVGIRGTGFDITLSGLAGLIVSGALSTRDIKQNKSYTSMPLYNKKCRLRMQYLGLQSTNPETKELNFSTARLQYLDYSTNSWTDIPDFVFSDNCWLGMSELNYCNMGLYPQNKELQKLTSMDLSKFKITANNDQITIFSPMYTPGETTMTDEEFYKNYKLDYDTWANALNKPL